MVAGVGDSGLSMRVLFVVQASMSGIEVVSLRVMFGRIESDRATS